MKMRRLMILICIGLLGSLYASYPDLSTVFETPVLEPELQDEVLITFLETWERSGDVQALPDLATVLPKRLASASGDLAQLRSVFELQQEQLTFSLANSRPRLGLQANPYSYSDTTAPAPSNARTKKHSFSVTGSISQALPTAGSVAVNVGHSSSYSMSSIEDSWTHTPQLSVQLQQPLWVGSSMIDGSYQRQQLEKQQVSIQSANLSIEALQQVLVYQNLNLLTLYQTLKETRFILQGRVQISASAMQKAESDLEAGLVSVQYLERARLTYYQVLSSLMAVERDLIDLESTLKETWGDEIPDQINPSGLDPFTLRAYFKDEQVLSTYLAVDPNYQSALHDLRKATIDSNFKDLSDAPQLSLSLNLSPFYDPTDDNTFFSSIDELFTTSHPVVSFSISFSASDLFRRSSSFKDESSKIALQQAAIAVEKAQQDAKATLREMELQLEGLMLDLLIGLENYVLIQLEWETEQIRFEAQLIDQDVLFAKQLDWYQAAFNVLATLRQIDVLYVQMLQKQLV